MEDPLVMEELVSLAERLRLRPTDWMRQSEPEWEARFDCPATPFNPPDDACLAAIAEAPVLLERPIFINGPAAVVGRPPELVLALAGAVPAGEVVTYAVCRLDKHGEYEATVVETPSEDGAHRLVTHYKRVSPEEWAWPEHHMIRRVDLARAYTLAL